MKQSPVIFNVCFFKKAFMGPNLYRVKVKRTHLFCNFQILFCYPVKLWKIASPECNKGGTPVSIKFMYCEEKLRNVRHPVETVIINNIFFFCTKLILC